MNEQEFEKARVEIQSLQGSIGGVPEREQKPAKFHLQRVIDQLRRQGEETQHQAVQLQALFNELPEHLSPQADAALEELLRLRPKRY